MKCTICGQATLPGAMLCRPCKAALKRARYLSVQEMPRASILRPRRSRSSAPKRTGGEAAAAKQPAAPRAEAPAPPPASPARALLAGAAAITVLAVVAYFGQRHMAAASMDATAQRAVREAPVASVPSPVPPTPALQAPIVPVAATPTTPARTGPTGGAESPTRPASTPRVPARVPPSPAPRQEPSAIIAIGATPDGFDPPPEPPRPAPPPPAPVARPAPPPDRWQSMASALSQCAREGGFGGFICDQKVRLESCEGYWGRVPQCPLPPENPGGQ